MRERVDRYRRQAEEALALMSGESDWEVRKVSAAIAEAWLGLAQREIESEPRD